MIDVTVIRETKSHWQLTGVTASCYGTCVKVLCIGDWLHKLYVW